MNSNIIEKLIVFCSSPRTVEAISTYVGSRITVPAMSELQIPGFTVFQNRDSKQCPIFMIKPRETTDIAKARMWNFWRDPKVTPLIWVQFDPAYYKKQDRVLLKVLSDVHLGHIEHNSKKFLADIKLIQDTPNMFTTLNGDMIENGLKDTHGTFDQILTPHEQVWGRENDPSQPGLVKLLWPIRHKIWWALPGNHEQRSSRSGNMCPLKAACKVLDVPYFKEPVFADLLTWNRVFNIYAQHGTGGGGTSGGQSNTSNKPTLFQNPMHFSIMGHVHNGKFNIVRRFVRRREYDENGKRVRISLEDFAQHNVILPSYLKYFNTYGSAGAMAPGSFESVICEMFNSGEYSVKQQRPASVANVQGLREVT